MFESHRAFATRVLFTTPLVMAILGLTGMQMEAKPAIKKISSKSAVSTRDVQDTVRDVDFSQLHVRYQPEPPEYPEVAKAQHIQGTVKVEVILGKDGVPKSVNAVSGPLVLRTSAERYSRHWRFDPWTIKAKDAKTQKTINYPVEARFYLSMPYKLQ
jgi:TonB family protein